MFLQLILYQMFAELIISIMNLRNANGITYFSKLIY